MAIQEKAWMSHFIQSFERLGGISPERQHLLIMDGYTSHITLEVVEEAKLGRLDLLTLLSHTSHTIQPLDCSIFNPFKAYFKAYRDYWQAQNLTKTTSKETLAHWILLALRKALSEKNIKNSFKGDENYPLNKEAIQ